MTARSEGGALHAPVMLDEAIEALAPVDGGIYVDGTLGAGGYTKAVLAAGETAVFAFDRDPTAISRAAAWAGGYGSRLTLVARPFAEMEAALGELGVEAVDGVVLDLGVSSTQLDEPARGFSFRADGPLSMRMDGRAPDARDVVNRGAEEDLALIFRAYGEERHSRRFAKAIAKARVETPIETTTRLGEIVEAATPPGPPPRIHPATRVFQALRIFVNDELGQLARGLIAAERLLRPAGRLVVVTFHSLEDRIVKQFLKLRADGAGGGASRHQPPGVDRPAQFRLLRARPVRPSEAEIARNPRARSAKLRAGARTDSPFSAAPVSAEEIAPPLHLSPAMNFWPQS